MHITDISYITCVTYITLCKPHNHSPTALSSHSPLTCSCRGSVGPQSRRGACHNPPRRSAGKPQVQQRRHRSLLGPPRKAPPQKAEHAAGHRLHWGCACAAPELQIQGLWFGLGLHHPRWSWAEKRVRMAPDVVVRTGWKGEWS